MNSFHIVLPSNSCADTHPDNNASKYTVSWQNPIQFLPSTDHWSVALTEINFLSTILSVNSSFGVRYTKMVTEWYYETIEINIQQLRDGDRHIMRTIHKDLKAEPVTVEYVDKVQKLKIYSKTKPFKVIFESGDFAEALGFTDTEVHSLYDAKTKVYYLISDPNSDRGSIQRFHIGTESGKFPKQEDIFISKEKSYATTVDMLQDIYQQFKDVFQVMELIESQRTCFQTHEHITNIQFLNKFHYALGFWESKFERSYEQHVSEFEPRLDMGFSNMYVYASICSPIQVGSVKVPLLRSLWITKHRRKIGEMQKIEVKRPMYLKVSSLSVNSININIRTDSGSFVPFPSGAVTSITLHFKREHVPGGKQTLCI